MYAAAHQKERPLGFGEQGGGALELPRIRALAARLRLQRAGATIRAGLSVS